MSTSSRAAVAVATTHLPPPAAAGAAGAAGAKPPAPPSPVSADSPHPFKSLGIYTFKGGTGKTTTTTHIAGSLAAMGHRVLAIDFDPQCNLTDLLNEGDSDWLDVNMEEYKIAADVWQEVDELMSENKGASSGGSRSSEPHVIQDVMSAEDKAKITAPKLSTFIDKERQNNGDHTVFKLFEPIFQSVNSDQMFDKIKTDEPVKLTGSSPEKGLEGTQRLSTGIFSFFAAAPRWLISGAKWEQH